MTVHHVSNVTDIDDKIIARAKAEGRAASDVAATVRGGVVVGDGRLGRASPDR